MIEADSQRAPIALRINPDIEAGAHKYVSTGRSGPEGVYQFGYDPESGGSWLRTLPSPDSRWTDWVAVDTAPRPHPVAVKSKAKAEDQEPEAPSKKK